MAGYIGFKKLEGKLADEPGVRNPGAVAASIGDKKYGKKAMERGSRTHASLKGIDAAMKRGQ